MLCLKNKTIKYVWFLLVSLLFCGCAVNKTEQLATSEDQSWDAKENVYDITAMDKNTDYTFDEYIDLSEASNSTYISSGGNYFITGSGNQTLIVDAEEQIVHLIFSNAIINVAKGPALYIKSSGKTIITLASDTTNVLIDGAYENHVLDADSALYAESDLTINGEGTLWVYAYRNAAIKSKDHLKILSGEINVLSTGAGLRGNDGVLIAGGTVNLECEKNGIMTTKAKKDLEGSIEIYDTNVNIVAGGYGLMCAANIYIKDCNVVNKGILGDLKYEGKAYIEEGKYSTN